MINNYRLIDRKLVPGEEILITCAEACTSPEYFVYGSENYSEDSPICKAAFHSGALTSDGGTLKMKIEKGL